MKLEKKKNLIARTLNIGKGRILFNINRLSEIKEAITKQDIKGLSASGAITIKDKAGRRKLEKKKTRRRKGSIKKKVKTRKKDYVILTRKLRAYLKSLKTQGKISGEAFKSLRKEIKASDFRSLSHMKEKIAQLKEAK